MRMHTTPPQLHRCTCRNWNCSKLARWLAGSFCVHHFIFCSFSFCMKPFPLLAKWFSHFGCILFVSSFLCVCLFVALYKYMFVFSLRSPNRKLPHWQSKPHLSFTCNVHFITVEVNVRLQLFYAHKKHIFEILFAVRRFYWNGARAFIFGSNGENLLTSNSHEKSTYFMECVY